MEQSLGPCLRASASCSRYQYCWKLKHGWSQESPERRLKGQQAMREEYQKRLCQNKHGPALKCVSCGLGIYDGNHFNVLGGAWHTACFACAECGCSFGNYGYYIRESEIAAAKEDKKRGKVCLPPKVYCFNHRKTSYLSRAFLSLTEATANLSRKVRGMPPKYWADHRGKCPNKLNSPALQQIHERGAPAAAQAATEVAVQAAAPVAALVSVACGFAASGFLAFGFVLRW